MKIDEENFIKLLIRRDERAMDYVIESYGWLIKSIVQKHLYSFSSDQGECINNILLAIWEHIESYDIEKGSFKNWLAGVSRFKCLEYKRKYLKNLEYENIDDLVIGIEDNTSENILRKELKDEIEKLLACLKDEDQMIFKKLYIDGSSIEDISKECAMSSAVIYNRISRGKKKIRKLSESRGWLIWVKIYMNY